MNNIRLLIRRRGERRGSQDNNTVENPGIKICWKKTTETDRIWADEPVSSALQKMGEFFNISNSYSPSISLTTTMNLCHKDRGVYKASTGNTRCEEGWGEEDMAAWANLAGIGCYSCAALLASGMICNTSRSTPGGWNETLGSCRSTGCITLLSSFQINSKAEKKKEKKKV